MTRNVRIIGAVKVQKNGKYGVKTTIPSDAAHELMIGPGDRLLIGIDENGRIIMTKQGVLA